MSRWWALPCWTLSALGVGGCFDVHADLGDCVVPCSTDCSDGYSCRNGWCVADASEATCAALGSAECSLECAPGCACRGDGCVDAVSGAACSSPPATATPALTPLPGCAAGCPSGCECADGACYLAGSALPCVARTPAAIQLAPKSLRAACSGLPYEADLAATGGEPPYAWELSSTTDLQLDRATGHLSGTLAGPGRRTLEIRVQDALGNAESSLVSLDVRGRCWFAYLSRETGAARLHVVDVRLSQHKVFPPASEPGADVFDFKFSPDGRYLAFRAGAAAGETRLRLVAADAQSDLDLPFTRSVLDYAWSADGRSLAVVLATGELDRYLLSGIGIDPPRQVWNERETTYRADLQWAGDEAVVYRGQTQIEIPDQPPISVPDAESPYIAITSANGIDVPRQILALQLQQSRLYAFPSGFMTRALNFDRIDGFRLGSAGNQDVTATFGYTSMAWSETHQHLMRLNDEHRFEVYSILDARAPLATSMARCDEVLAWRSLPDRERAVCLDAVTSGCAAQDGLSGTLRLFDFFPESHRLDEHLVAGCYQAAGAALNPRMLSRQGRWFVFGVAGNFTIAGFADASLRFGSLIENGDQRAYEVSPDETRLLVQMGDRLILLDLSPAGDLVPISGPERPALPPEPCTAVFADERDGWCGTGNLRHARWAADSMSLVYQARDGVLWLADVSLPDQPPEVHQLSATAACPNGCVDSYAFQPSP